MRWDQVHGGWFPEAAKSYCTYKISGPESMACALAHGTSAKCKLNNAHDDWFTIGTASLSSFGETISPCLQNVPTAVLRLPDSSKLNQTVNPETREVKDHYSTLARSYACHSCKKVANKCRWLWNGSGQSQQRKAYPGGNNRASREPQTCLKQIKHHIEPSLIGLFWQALT